MISFRPSAIISSFVAVEFKLVGFEITRVNFGCYLVLKKYVKGVVHIVFKYAQY